MITVIGRVCVIFLVLAAGVPVVSGNCTEPGGKNPSINTPGEQKEQHALQSDVLAVDPIILTSLSEEERDWYVKFQEGVMFFDGWVNISQTILESYPVELQAAKKKLIQRLGVRIGTEWCRDNDTRRIDTQMLKAWGQQIRAAVAEGHEVTTAILQKIEKEVNLLLQQNSDVASASPRS